jgi:hypothetical protein
MQFIFYDFLISSKCMTVKTTFLLVYKDEIDKYVHYYRQLFTKLESKFTVPARQNVNERLFTGNICFTAMS